jgi:hypothetical protein
MFTVLVEVDLDNKEGAEHEVQLAYAAMAQSR